MSKKIIRVSDAIPEMPLSFDRTVEQTLKTVCTAQNKQIKQAKTPSEPSGRQSDKGTLLKKQKRMQIFAYSAAAVLLVCVLVLGGVMTQIAFRKRKLPEIPMADVPTETDGITIVPNETEPTPAIRHDGTLYLITGIVAVGELDQSAIVGHVTSVVPLSECPTENGQANFGEVGAPYAMTEDGLFVLFGNEWCLFKAEEFNDPALIPTVTPAPYSIDESDALCVFTDGSTTYLPYENWIWADQDDGLAADGISFLWKIEEVKDKIPTIYNPAELTVKAGDGVNLEPQVNIYDETLNTVAFGADISTVCTLDPGTYYVSQRVSRREEGRNAGYECVVRVVIGKETEHVTYSVALSELLQTEEPETNVEIRIIGLDYGNALESAFVYRGKTLTEYREQPALRAYSEAYDAWYFDEYPAIDEQNRNTPGWEKHDPMSLFDASWRERHSEAEIQAYEQAWEAYVNARNAFIDWRESEAGREALQAIYRQECDRLNACGFSLRVDPQNGIEGTATVGLLRSFPAKDGYQYWITLVDDTSPIDE